MKKGEVWFSRKKNVFRRRSAVFIGKELAWEVVSSLFLEIFQQRVKQQEPRVLAWKGLQQWLFPAMVSGFTDVVSVSGHVLWLLE